MRRGGERVFGPGVEESEKGKGGRDKERQSALQTGYMI